LIETFPFFAELASVALNETIRSIASFKLNDFPLFDLKKLLSHVPKN